jgi:hypothetical protein
MSWLDVRGSHCSNAFVEGDGAARITAPSTGINQHFAVFGKTGHAEIAGVNTRAHKLATETVIVRDFIEAVVTKA